MRSFCILLPLLGLAALTTSCKSTKTASTNAYQNNPYYSSSGNTTNYSSTPSNSSYPSYTENTYTPPTSVPSVPSVPTYNQPTYTGPATSGGSSAPVSYTGSGSKTHTVSSGENLYRISQKNGTTVAALKSANGLTSDVIRPGQQLVIP